MKQGFTLVELSIVLVIIGLIIAGVTAGMGIVKNAQLQSIVIDINNIKTSYNSFLLKYNAVPGDMKNAYNYWGSSCATSAALCNGDGDGLIEWGGSVYYYEPMIAWKHLNASNLYPNGLSGTGTAYTAANSPNGKIANSIYFLQSLSIWTWNKTSNNLYFMKTPPAGQWWGIISVADAFSIDSKIDDGIANKGTLYAMSGDDVSSTACSAAKGAGTGADYNMRSIVKNACFLVYRLMK